MTPEHYVRLLDDLSAEFAEFGQVVGSLDASGWTRETPSAGWTVRDQISHVAEFNDVAALALADRDAFVERRDSLLALGDAWVDLLAWRHRARRTHDIVDWLNRSCTDILQQLRGHAPDARMPWFGPDMSAASCATARLMETWAHGQDILDTVGSARHPTTRLTHICHLGVLTRPFAFTIRGLEAPTEPVHVALLDHLGVERTWGPENAVDQVRGTMQDFALVVTRRRHLDETSLTYTEGAEEWLGIAQAYAGGPGGPRARISVSAPEPGVSGGR